MGRTITRHAHQAALDRMREKSRSAQARRDTRLRQHPMGRSFARASRFGFDQARWRGLWRVRIQEYLTATIQNIDVLIRYGGDPRRRLGMLMKPRNREEPPMWGVGGRMILFLCHPTLEPRAAR